MWSVLYMSLSNQITVNLYGIAFFKHLLMLKRALCLGFARHLQVCLNCLKDEINTL